MYRKYRHIFRTEKNIFENINNTEINLEQFKNILTNTQGNADLTNICEMYNLNFQTLLSTIKQKRPIITSLSLKNLLTRLSNSLFQSMDKQINENIVTDSE